MSSAKPRMKTTEEMPMTFQARIWEKGTKKMHARTKPPHRGTPPKKHGVLLCQRSVRGCATQPCRRQMRIAVETRAAASRQPHVKASNACDDALLKNVACVESNRVFSLRERGHLHRAEVFERIRCSRRRLQRSVSEFV